LPGRSLGWRAGSGIIKRHVRIHTASHTIPATYDGERRESRLNANCGSGADGVSPRHNDKWPVARVHVNPILVSRTAPDLFPVMSLVKEWFTRRRTEEHRAFALSWIFLSNTLKLL
jgi:hypothetical protein